MASFKRFSSSHELLQHELNLIKNKNSAFSMRSFARLISLSPSHLSQVLAGKKKLSIENAMAVSQKLNFTAEREKYFCLLVQFDSATPQARSMIQQKIDVAFTKMSSKKLTPGGKLSKVGWTHLMILVGLDLKKKLDDQALQALSEFTGKKKAELNLVLKDLLKAGLVKESGGIFERTHQKMTIESADNNRLLRDIHIDYLERLKTLIDTRAVEKRYSVTEFYSISPSKMPILKERAAEFLDEVVALSDEEPSGMLELSLHFNSFSEEEVFGLKD